MKHTICFNLAWQWRYLTDKTGFLFIGTHCIACILPLDCLTSDFWIWGYPHCFWIPHLPEMKSVYVPENPPIHTRTHTHSHTHTHSKTLQHCSFTEIVLGPGEGGMRSLNYTMYLCIYLSWYFNSLNINVPLCLGTKWKKNHSVNDSEIGNPSNVSLLQTYCYIIL